MTIEEIEKRLGSGYLWTDKHINLLLSEVKRLREGIKIAIFHYQCLKKKCNVSEFDEELFEELYKLLED